MSARQQALFWIAAAAFLLLFLSALSGILLPFVLGAGIAYLLDPLADRLQRVGLSRLMATIVIVALFGLVVVVVLIGLVPLLVEQLGAFAARLPGYFQSLRELAAPVVERFLEKTEGGKTLGLDGALGQLAERAANTVQTVVTSVLSGGLALVNFLALLLVTPVVTFYLLKDWDRLIERIDGWLPRQHQSTIRRLAREMDEVISGFVRGQGLVLTLLSLIYIVGLTLIGLNFGLLIGLAAGLISFIPYLGPIVGFLLGGGVAIVQFWPDWMMILAVLGVFVVGQAVEGNILSPLIVGDRVRLHPVWLIFALFVFGFLFGFVGLLLAVPLAAAIGVLVRFGLHKYLESPLYGGQGPGGSGPSGPA